VGDPNQYFFYLQYNSDVNITNTTIQYTLSESGYFIYLSSGTLTFINLSMKKQQYNNSLIFIGGEERINVVIDSIVFYNNSFYGNIGSIINYEMKLRVCLAFILSYLFIHFLIVTSLIKQQR
jgi:hypothetical protein